MTYLKIDNDKVLYRIDGAREEWMEIDQISKDHMLILLKLATQTDFEMDEYKDELIKNPAHNIIYKNIYNKFSELLEDKTRFQDSTESMYKSAIEKYQKEVEEEE